MNAGRLVWFLLVGLLFLPPLIRAEDPGDISKIPPEVLTPEQRRDALSATDREITRRTSEANARNRTEWAAITTREQWEKYRDSRIAALRRALADFPEPPAKLNFRITGSVRGDGFNIENVVFESRPRQWVTANLYVPAKPGKSMPGLLLAHAHHRDKPESELQDMGMTWARAGCLVLVIDQVGYGERRSHPFHRAEDFARQYAVSRQDYYFRYDSGVQLSLLGDSLMGWMAWDLMRGVDLLLAREGIDPKRIAILGSVAGGGDPAGVTAALDPRIACCVPFNFGGPQPETRYPLPDDAETSFNYLGGSYWESTRGLRLGGRDDFPHWVIVASTAPRYLIHAHEFAWDKEHDPVWKRYQKIWGDFYGAADKTGVAHGKGTLKGRPPEASHCNNIGKFHRQMIHPLFEKWLGIKVSEQDEYSMRLERPQLISMTDKAREELKPKSLTEIMSTIAQERIDKARQNLAGKSPAEQRKILREQWSRLLGPVEPKEPPLIRVRPTIDEQVVAGASVERVILEVEKGIVVPLLILKPTKATEKSSVVVGLAQGGKAGFLKERSAEIQKLLQGGSIVVLPDLRGTGETHSGTSRGRTSNDTGLSTSIQLFGESLLGQRLRDLISVLGYVRSRPDVDGKRIALWGDSFTPANPAETNFKVPHNVEGWPKEAEPLGGLLALLGTLFDEEIAAVEVDGGLAGYLGVLNHFSVHIPHDATVPGVLTTGDLCDLAGSLAPRPLRFQATVDHLNRIIPVAELKKEYAPTLKRYSEAPAALSFGEKRAETAEWLLKQLK